MEVLSEKRSKLMYFNLFKLPILKICVDMACCRKITSFYVFHVNLFLALRRSAVQVRVVRLSRRMVRGMAEFCARHGE